MKYTVVWLPNAQKKLTDLWLNSPNRQQVTDAANVIDTLLRDAPESAGESRDDGRRMLHERPLGIVFRVHAEDRRVAVIDVWRFKQRA